MWTWAHFLNLKAANGLSASSTPRLRNLFGISIHIRRAYEFYLLVPGFYMKKNPFSEADLLKAHVSLASDRCFIGALLAISRVPLLFPLLTAAVFIFPRPAYAGEFLTNGQIVGVENGKPISNFRTDGCVRFDPFGPKPHFTANQASDAPASGERYVLPLGGDIDGDGEEDVLQVELAFDEQFAPLESVFIARSGKSGHELWRAQLGAGIFWGGYLPGDATGDGRPDLAFTTVED